jgi:Reverse transcriptase (RNA-dependent DNA polymerase)
MKWQQFSRWFNRDFWRAFRNRTFPIKVPESRKEREETVRKVYDAIVSARYAASIPEAEIVTNKGYGVARTIPVFCIEDYIVFYFCIKELEEVLCGNRTENTFGGWTLGGRMRRLEEIDVEFDVGFSNSRYSFDPHAWIAAFGEFNSLLFAQLDTGAYSHVLQFDLSNFYDSIRLDILERWIREESPASKGWIITLLFYFLNQWNRKNTGLHPQAVGIPQDALADCSRILANFYLQKYDKFAYGVCTKADALYFRYSDDQMILLKDTSQVERLMLLLARHLDRFGLHINQKKIDLWTVKQLQKYRCRSIQKIFAKKGDNQDKAKVRKFTGAYLAIPAKKLETTWNRGFPLLNRLLWANIESLPRRYFEKLLARYTSEDYLLRADIEKLGRVAYLNSKRKKPIAMTKRLIEIGDRCEHNAFHFEVLAFARNSKKKALAAHFKKRLRAIDKLMECNVVG